MQNIPCKHNWVIKWCAAAEREAGGIAETGNGGST